LSKCCSKLRNRAGLSQYKAHTFTPLVGPSTFLLMLLAVLFALLGLFLSGFREGVWRRYTPEDVARWQAEAAATREAQAPFLRSSESVFFAPEANFSAPSKRRPPEREAA
jgi:hypothetical protein